MAARKKKRRVTRKKKARNSYTDEQKAEVLKFIKGGHTQADASRKFGIGATVIMHWRRQFGVDARGKIIRKKVAKRAAKRKVAKKKVPRTKAAKRKVGTIESLCDQIGAHHRATNAILQKRRKTEEKLSQRLLALVQG